MSHAYVSNLVHCVRNDFLSLIRTWNPVFGLMSEALRERTR